MLKNKFTGTATQPQCNRKFCQFNKEQYSTKGYPSNMIYREESKGISEEFTRKWFRYWHLVHF